MPIVISAEDIGVNPTLGVCCLMCWVLRCTRLRYVVVFDSAANFVANCWKVPRNKPSRWIIFCKLMASDDVGIWKRKLMIWKHFVKGFEGCVGWMDPTDRSLCFIYKRSDCEMNLEKHNITWCLCVLFSDYDFCYTWLCFWIFISRSVRPCCSRWGA